MRREQPAPRRSCRSRFPRKRSPVHDHALVFGVALRECASGSRSVAVGSCAKQPGPDRFPETVIAGEPRQERSGQPQSGARAHHLHHMIRGGFHMTTRKQASDFPQEVLALFDGYVHGFIQRRDFLEGAGKVLGWRRGCSGSPRGASSQLRVGAAGGTGGCPDPAGIRHVPVAEWLGDDAWLHGHARRRDGSQARGFWSSTRIAASTPTSKTWCAGSPPRISWRWGRTRSHPWAAIRVTTTKAGRCSGSSTGT